MSDIHLNRALPEWLEGVFKTADWPIPPYLQIGFLSSLAKSIEVAAPNVKAGIMCQHMAQAYTPEYLAVMLLERYSKILHVRDFKPQIGESIKAYFCGYKFAAVTALIPVVEGIIRKIAIAEGRNVGSGTNRLNIELQAIIDRELSSPHGYGERVVLLESFRDFIKDRFLQSTSAFVGADEFNRHGILHGIFEKFGEEANFLRLITLLDLLCFSIGMTIGGVSMFAPPLTADSSMLAQHYAQLQSVVSTLNVHLPAL